MSLGVVALAAGSVSAQLYSNAGGYGSGAIGLSSGSITGSGVSAPAGFEWSELQSDGAGNANASAGFTSSPGFRIADDFTIPVGQTWDITNIMTYAYQTGSAANTQPINGGSINIWNGAPNAGGTIIATGTFGGSANTNLYRLFNTTTPAPGTAPGTTRLLREVTWNFSGVSLAAGTYWIDFQYIATNGGTVFAPSITLPGTRGLNGWNALQFSGGTNTWAAVVDAGNPSSAPDVAQDFPFVIVPAPSAAAMLGLGVLTLGRRRR
jgi:hypothetical protein